MDDLNGRKDGRDGTDGPHHLGGTETTPNGLSRRKGRNLTALSDTEHRKIYVGQLQRREMLGGGAKSGNRQPNGSDTKPSKQNARNNHQH